MKEDVFTEELLAQAHAAGFADAAVISTKEFVFVPEYRKYCEQNLCGNYDKNYGCPPYCGTVEAMHEKACRYRKALVLQTQVEAHNIYDDAETKEYKKQHTAKIRRLMRTLREKGLIEAGMPIMAGPCNLCPTCKMVEGQPCPHGEEQFSCLSAYCIDVGRLAASCQMKLAWTGNIVYFFSIYLFEEHM